MACCGLILEFGRWAKEFVVCKTNFGKKLEAPWENWSISLSCERVPNLTSGG